jgi:hypothetical protein
MTTIAIHQPEYFPWLGYLDKMRRSDVFVLLDSVQFDRSSLQQRARVMGSNGPVWMTIPFVHRFPQRIDEVQTVVEDRWRSKHLKTLQACYGRAAGYASAAPQLAAFFAAELSRLVDVTVASVELLAGAFRAAENTRIVRSSELPVAGDKGDLVLAICRHFGATRYLSGRSGAAYLDAERFRHEGIEIEVQSFVVPEYPRIRLLTGDESHGLSALDAWLHLGTDAPGLFKGAQP